MSSGYWGGDTPLGNAERVSLAIRTHDWTPLLATPLSHKTTPEVPLLDKLRGGGMPRPDVDPELAGGLREWLEDSLAGSAASLPRRSPVVRVNKQVLTDVVPGGKLAGVADHRKTAHDRIFRSLMLCLFRQWVTTRRFGQPIEDALAALEVQGDPGGTVQAVNRLSPEMRQALSDETAAHAARIAATWPVLCPAWYPRTRERISIPLCGGRILLGGVVDLVIGAQAADEATVCIVQIDTTPGQDQALLLDLHFHALLETLRAGASPCRVARYSTGTGEIHAETVDEHVLVGALLKTVEAAQRACATQAESSAIGAGGPR